MTRLCHAIAILAAALAFGGCGSDEEGEPIPQANVTAIENQLDNIESQINEGSQGACDDITKPNNTYEALQAAVEQVPSDVDADTRDALVKSVDRLGDLVEEECTSREAETETTPEETETVTIPTVTETVPLETEPTETVPEEDGEQLPPGQEKKDDKLGKGEGGGTEPGGGETGGGLSVPGGDG